MLEQTQEQYQELSRVINGYFNQIPKKKKMKNTIALAYLNSEGEIVAWSADTFGSPRDYPKTYRDTEENRVMLLKKFKTREKFAESAIKEVTRHTDVGGAIMAASIEADKDIFSEKGIIKSQIVALNLVTDYSINLPTWEQVKTCINDKDYTLIS